MKKILIIIGLGIVPIVIWATVILCWSYLSYGGDPRRLKVAVPVSYMPVEFPVKFYLLVGPKLSVNMSFVLLAVNFLFLDLLYGTVIYCLWLIIRDRFRGTELQGIEVPPPPPADY